MKFHPKIHTIQTDKIGQRWNKFLDLTALENWKCKKLLYNLYFAMIAICP
jgi:hypothetical protein